MLSISNVLKYSIICWIMQQHSECRFSNNKANILYLIKNKKCFWKALIMLLLFWIIWYFYRWKQSLTGFYFQPPTHISRDMVFDNRVIVQFFTLGQFCSILFHFHRQFSQTLKLYFNFFLQMHNVTFNNLWKLILYLVF